MVLAQRMADGGAAVAPWAVCTALLVLASLALRRFPLRWSLAGAALVGATAAWALLPAAWWAIATLLRRGGAGRGIAWFALGIALGLAAGWAYFLS